MKIFLVGELNAKGLVISFGEYRAANVEEIPVIQEGESGIEFQVTSPYLVINISKYPSVYASDNSLEVAGAIAKIKKIFDRSVSSWSKIRRVISNLLLLVGLLAIFASIGYFGVNFRGIPSLLIAVFSFVFSYKFNTLLDSHIEFEFKNVRKNFWKKNRDTIYVGLIVGIPTALISFLLGKFL